MKEIRIIYPDDCTEKNAMLYAHGCFTPCQHDYKKERPLGKKNAEVIVFADNRRGLFYLTKSGYNLELKAR